MGKVRNYNETNKICENLPGLDSRLQTWEQCLVSVHSSRSVSADNTRSMGSVISILLWHVKQIKDLEDSFFSKRTHGFHVSFYAPFLLCECVG
jgi:hypothetical protein